VQTNKQTNKQPPRCPHPPPLVHTKQAHLVERGARLDDVADGGDPGDPFDGGDEERFSPLHFALSAQADSAALFLLEVRSTLATLATTWPAHMDTQVYGSAPFTVCSSRA